MPIWISTVNAMPNFDAGPFKNYKGVVVNVVTYAENRDVAIKNITQELSEYYLRVESIDDLEIFQPENSLQTKKLHRLAAKSQKNFTTEFDVFYTYDE
ncbi:hypothetical protein IC235_16990 [Hymenobacter sp. BT664]|uniref:Uncharacterized protein n=1 Tax=Hymenobacter montanus TaxID=2771359 RepID=A0A927GKI0_9BACT|nr:hypothetical protein [Hymenobacter montanus]MBD2769587.1 hypothetical protein [Hymenobacter montanus]